MKLQTAFKLSALMAALVSASATFAATLNSSELGNDTWTDPRAEQTGNVDTSAYQYVDVGSSANTSSSATVQGVTNKLTEWYHLDGLSDTSTDAVNILKVTDIATNSVQYYAVDDSNLGVLADLDQQGLIDYFNAQTSSASAVQLNDLTEITLSADQLAALSQSTTKPILAGLTKTSDLEQTSSALVRRLDSNYLEYSDETVTTESKMVAEGNLTNDDTANSLVHANVDTQVPEVVKISTTNDSIKTGIINDAFNPGNTVYGVVASKTATVQDLLAQTTTVTEQSTTLTSQGIKIVETTDENTAETVITAGGITTGSLIVDGVDVGQALGNVSILGNLSTEDINSLVNSGQTLTALQDDVTALQTDLSALDTKVDSEVSRLDDRIDTELAANASASTAYTDNKVADTATELRAEAALESTRVDQAISAGDTATLTAANTYTDTAVSNVVSTANAYTDTQIAGVNTRVDQLNKRVDDVEQTSYRGIAIALAAQQQIPNIGAGQFAVFGGVGHYEGESAVALGVASVFADGRTSVSAALGVAGGSEIGGRVGVSYVFGGK